MENYKIVLIVFFITSFSFAQIGIGTTTPNASLDIVASSQSAPANTDGVLIPRIDEFPGINPGANQDGMLVYATGSGTPTKGFYYWDNGTASWIIVSGSGASKVDDLTDGKSDNDGTQDGSSVFLGVNTGLNDDSTDNKNVGIGFEALKTNSTGQFNIAIGYNSLKSNATGITNTAVGVNSLMSNANGNYNTSIGGASLVYNTQGNGNSAIGYGSLFNNITGGNNTALGYNSGRNNSSGTGNVFIGYRSGEGANGSNKLYIENSNADANDALIYGEFDNNILRANSEFQIGNPIVSGYAFPTTDGTANQVLQTDGSGQVSWGNAIGASKINELSDGKSDNDGTQDGSSVFLGIDAGLVDDSTDNQNVGVGFEALKENTVGVFNTANGYQSLKSNTTGGINTAIGNGSLTNNTTGGANVSAGYNSLKNNTIGGSNVALGVSALLSNKAGNNNVAIGWGAMTYANSTSTNFYGYNVAVGSQALSGSTTPSANTGKFNTALGGKSLLSNTSADYNTAVGYNTMNSNTTGVWNTALGSNALYSNTNGQSNIATGLDALYSNTIGGYNIASGYKALYNNIDGNSNIAIGANTLFSNTSGHYNVGIGSGSLNAITTGHTNIAIGSSAGSNNTTGFRNIYLGYLAGYNHTGDHTLWIEDSNADENGALIYGEFDNDILRTNSEFQIGNPTGTGYAFPTVDGAANQVLQTNGSGAVSWVTISSPTVSGTANYIAKFTGPSTVGNSLVYDNGANVGIGTTTPSYKLSVNGPANLNQGIASGTALRVNGAEALWYNGTYFSWGFGGNANYFSDNVGIGVTAPSTKLHLKHSNSGASGGFKIENVDTTNSNYWRMYTSSGVSGDLRLYSSVVGGTTITGWFNGTSGAYSSVSDKRLKKNFTNLHFDWDDFMKLNTQTYQFKAQKDSKKHIGLVAQEVQKIYPELVSYTKKEDVYHLDYSGAGIVAIKAVQELNKKVEVLTEKNKKLNGQLLKYKQLEKRLEALEQK